MYDPLIYRQEIYRKLIHLSSSCIPFMLWYFGKDIFQPWIISCAIILPILDYGRRYNKLLYRTYSKLFLIITRPIEHGILTGASWVMIGSAATIFIFNEDTAIIGLLVLTIADSAAAIIGIKFGETHLFSKSLEGSAAFSLKINMVTAAPIITHEAPDNIPCSIGRVNVINKLLYMRYRNLLCLLPKSKIGKIIAQDIIHG